MSAVTERGREDPEGIEFVEAGWDVAQIYRADPLLPPFFEALKQGRLLAGRADGPDGRVIFPPSSFCEESYSEVTELVPVGPRGIIRSFTVLPGPPQKLIVFVQLEGADTASPGYLRGVEDEDMQALALVGAPCHVVFAEDRKGAWSDFWFERS